MVSRSSTSHVSLVTGGAGFMGSHLTRELLAMGHRVVVLDDLSGGFRENVPPNAELIVGSITNAELVADTFARCRFDFVYHLAAYAAEGLSHFIRRFNYTNNLIGSVNLINEAVRNDVRHFVFTSSIAIYGAAPIVPVDETTPAHPEDPYGIAKHAVESDLRVAHDLFGLPYTVFRPHNVFGEYQNLGDRYRNVVGIFMNQVMAGKPLTIFGDGTQTRAFTYIADVIPGIARAVSNDAARNQTFNVGSDRVCSVRELADAVLRVTGASVDREFLPARNEVVHIHARHDRFRSVFGQPSQTPLEEGLARMWEWAEQRGATSPSTFGAIEVDRNLPPSWR